MVVVVDELCNFHRVFFVIALAHEPQVVTDGAMPSKKSWLALAENLADTEATFLRRESATT